MVLLTVIAVGLLGLSSISIRSSSRGDAMAIARANARMALYMAIGELQKEMGPDQRVSATADLAGSTTGDALGPGTPPTNNTPIGGGNKGLTAVQNGTRYWTGVWQNANVTNPGTLIYTRSPVPQHRKWLISGNEVGAPGSNAYTPGDQQVSVEGDGSVRDTSRAVVLVGKGTAGDANPETVSRYVSAPLVEIASDNPSSRNAAGRHAWWIGDEGVKAKMNLRSPFDRNNDANYRSLAAQRRGWETVDGFENYPAPGTPGEQSIPKLISIPQAGLMDPHLRDSGGVALGRAFHSGTTESFGVLTDTLQGGLRIDLTAGLAQGLPTTAPGGILNGMTATSNIIPQSVTSRNMKGPKWSRLQDFYEMGKTLRTARSLAVKPATGTADAAIAPIIADFRLLLGVRLVNSGGGNNFKTQPCAKVAVSLANPYPYPLSWSTALDLEVKSEFAPGQFSPRPACIFDGPGQPAFLAQNASEAAVLNRALFRIPAGTLAPGEGRAYCVSGQTIRPPGSTTQVVVNMGVFNSSAPSDFKNCVILDTTATADFGSGKRLDVREATITSQCTVELRTAGSNTAVLRRLERFDLDNAPYAVTARDFNAATARQFVNPVPLQYYGFQVSQPGYDYGTILPSRDQLGLRSSTLRTYADFNLQATRFRKPIISYNPPPYFMMIANSQSALPFAQPGGDTGGEFTKNMLADPLPWGHSPFSARRTVLFSPPSELTSLAQLQHADLTGDDYYASVGHQPGNAVGNSYASPFLPRVNTVKSRTDFTITGFSSQTSAATNYYDISYLLNAALWDTYFFSTMPDTGPAEPLNPAMVKVDPEDNSPEMRSPLEAAGHLLVNGAHNINCTDKDAWKALLASSKYLKHPSEGGSGSDAIFPRSLEQPVNASLPPTGTQEDSFAGFRKLSDAELDAVATELARQVRLRGPFVSLSQFVNRSLVSLTQANVNNPQMQGRSGAIQAALDLGGMNITPDGTKTVFTSIANLNYEKVNLQADGGRTPRADLVGGATTDLPSSGTDGVWPPTSHDKNPGAIAGILADKDMLTQPRFRTEQGFRSTGIPGWITQADVLQIIGPVISARSDTFRIRAYGESLDPNTGTPVARAWCEAIVQRMPEYVDGSDEMTERGTELTPVNEKFGRRFQTVSFKWLSPDEI
ncbi:hypothetical protein [Luteolibacter luteus]|uniref:Uncharacterized protein n=1 Tax=Luteolibacter luteus TaxID=2728835 RepID=A0A858RRG1_9BACT|nr:hypothetical protein [Luteolibacter luteus]QJE98720.1 hypothetical protein HHL09_24045 [Luteolibacter luteus]